MPLKGDESFQSEMLLLRKDGPYSQFLSICAGFTGIWREERECCVEYWVTEVLKYCNAVQRKYGLGLDTG